MGSLARRGKRGLGAFLPDDASRTADRVPDALQARVPLQLRQQDEASRDSNECEPGRKGDRAGADRVVPAGGHRCAPTKTGGTLVAGLATSCAMGKP